jgi:hypothetical protein
MIKWITKSGNKTETNENPANIKAAELAGWTKDESKKKKEGRK